MIVGRRSGRGVGAEVGLAAALALAGCGGGGTGGSSGTTGGSGTPAATTPAQTPREVVSVAATSVASFAAPWSTVFLPDGRLIVAERSVPGRLSIVTQAGVIASLATGLPSDNLGILDVALHPQFAANRLVYFTFIEPGDPAVRIGRGVGDPSLSPSGLALATGVLAADASGGARLDNVRAIWRQTPKIVSFAGSGEYGGRLAFSPDGVYLFLTAGDRQEFEPVQQLDNSLGKTIRLFADGTIPPNNSFAGRAGALPEIWTLGHRNPYGLAFDASGRQWQHEMGPMGGDEFNLIEPGGNYGWPLVSHGSAYTGEKYPDPKPGDGFVIAAKFWTPVIAPAGLIFYTGTMFETWKSDAILTGLQSRGLVRVRVSGTTATEVQRVDLGARIREVEQGPDGALWVLEDAPTGRLLRLTPVF